MKKIQGVLFGFILLLFIVLPGCSKHTSMSTAELLDFFTSEQCQGRLVGSSGNQVAADFIKEYYSNLDFQVYSGTSYGIPYTQADTYFPDQSNYSFEVERGGAWETLMLGEDYLPILYRERCQGEFVLVEDTNTENLTQSAVLLTDLFQRENVLKKEPEVLLFPSESMTTGVQPEGSVLQIKLTQAGLSKMKDVARIRVDFQSELVPDEVENIVGVLPGADRTRAMILSAHYDHAGTIGTVMFPGAYDNASGITALLRLAEELASQGTPPVDIIFCAFNGEENGQQGSAAFVHTLDSRYTYEYAVNLDCVGSMEIPNTYLVYSDGTTDSLDQALIEALQAGGLQSGVGGLMQSDHLSFSKQDFCSVSVGQDGVSELHTPADTTQILLPDQIDVFCQALIPFFMSSGGADFSHGEMSDHATSDHAGDALAQFHADEFLEETPLPYDKQYIFSLDGTPYYVTGNRALITTEEVDQYYPNFFVPDQLLGLPFDSFMSCIRISEEYDEPGRVQLYDGPFSGTPVVTERPLFQQGEELFLLTYRSGTRMLEICAINTQSGKYSLVDGMLGLSSGTEAMEGEYAGYTLRYGDLGEDYYDGFSYKLTDSPYTLYVSLCDKGEIEVDGIQYRRLLIDLGRNRREDIVSLIDKFREVIS